MAASVVVTFAGRSAIDANQQQKEAQLGTRLEREGGAALEKFKFEQTEGLLLAMQSVNELIPFEKEGRSIEAYPAASPLLATQTGLDRIRETVTKGHQGRVLSVSYSPNGKTLATSGEDGTARIWDTSGKELAQLKGHQGSITSVSYSPNGKTLATSGEDGTARIWDTSGRQIAQYEGRGYVNPNWTIIATVNSSPTNSNDQIVTLHPLTVSPTALLDRACQKLKYYILQSPELKDDRKMCKLEN